MKKKMKMWHKTLTKMEEKPTEVQGRQVRRYKVEPEAIETARLHADFFIRRYKKQGYHWKRNEERTTYVGLLGQKIFDLVLTQAGIAKDVNDPTVEWAREKPYDFYIPEVGTVEIKCFDHYCKKVLVKVSEWHNTDYMIAMKLGNREATDVYLMGYLTGEQVNKLPISKKGETWEDGTTYTPNADAYITDFADLKDIEEFLSILSTFSLKLEKPED